MKVDGHSLVLGIIGDPVKHSFSPLLHNAFAEAEGVNTVYVPFPVKREDIEAAVRGAYALGIQGLNVTVPHKEAVIPYLTDIDPMAAEIGAVNCLVRTDGGYKGYNTDALGFIRTLELIGADVKGKECVMLGAGGAANAVLHALLNSGAQKVWVLNRSADKAKSKFGHIDKVEVLSMDEYGKIPEGGLFCAQCTSVGLSPDVEKSPIADPAFFKRIEKAVDIIYSPEKTRFMALAEENGCAIVNGINMLIYQAVEAYKLFTGHSVSVNGIDRAKEIINGASHT
ncbi:MAG: shikimate dehydrogenase [Lachnospiraceae bacterium]|nr:shikimate dehydrogenase [Lachnospiraceae bacterium]